MPSTVLLDACGRRRSPATLSSFHQGRAPRNRSQRYPADPPTVEEIIAVRHAAGDDHDAVRLRGLIVVLWRAGLRISEALALSESDLDLHRGAILVRRGKGGKRREVGMDRWAWEQLSSRLQLRAAQPVGALFCVLRGPTTGRAWAPAGVRAWLHHAPPAREYDDDSRPISCATPTPWRCREKASHCSSSSAGWDTPTSRSPPFTTRHRQHRDRPRRPRTPRNHDPGHPRPVELLTSWWVVAHDPPGKGEALARLTDVAYDSSSSASSPTQIVISRASGGQSDPRGRCAGASDERGGSTFDAATVKISREWGMERVAGELGRGGLPR
jgi:hypothetical protein